MKHSFIFILLTLITLQLNSQNVLRGKVTDAKKSPLAGATVYMPDLNKGTVT